MKECHKTLLSQGEPKLLPLKLDIHQRYLLQ